MRAMQDRSIPPALPSVGVVVSRYNDSVTSRLLAGALDEYARRGGDAEEVRVAEAPGAFELPVIAKALLESEPLGAVVALGCIIRGETEHHRYLGDAVAKGLMDLALEAGVPVGFGVLTVDHAQEALNRAGGSMGNKGAEAMSAALDAARVIESIGGRHGGRSSRTGFIAAAPDKARGMR